MRRWLYPSRAPAMLALTGLALGLALSPTPAHADLAFFTSFGAFQSTPGSDVDNVIFTGTGVVNGPATTVVGRLNASSDLFQFTSSDNPENMIASGGLGQAEISAQDGVLNNTITMMFVPPKEFTALAADFHWINKQPTTVDIAIREADNSVTHQSHTIDTGNNFFGVIASNGQSIISVAVDAPSDAGYESLEHVRVGGFQGQVVPEPGAMALLIPGLLPVGLLLRRRQRKGNR